MRLHVKNYDDLQYAVEMLCAFLSEQNLSQEKVFDSKLVAVELLGNALQHSGAGATFQAEIEKDYLHITVRGERIFCPPKESQCPKCHEERGRGLFLVDSVCEQRSYQDGEILVRIRL